MGRAIAATCEGPLSDSEEALAAKRRGVVTEAFEAVVLDIIVTCGIVSNMTTSMVDPDHAYYYNSSAAHAFYNAWTGISPELVEEHPHGAVVAFGVLVLWAFDGRMDELARYASLNRRLGLPVTLSAIGATAEDVPGIVGRAQATNEWGRAPYGYTAERFGQAVLTLTSTAVPSRPTTLGRGGRPYPRGAPCPHARDRGAPARVGGACPGVRRRAVDGSPASGLFRACTK